MNYQHAFHAGNHSEVFKHAALCLLLDELLKKPKPFFVLDTHAGAGIYDLSSDEARRTGEADQGVRRVFKRPLWHAKLYLDLVEGLNPGETVDLYPGSPAIIRHFLREGDRLVACELKGDDAFELKNLMAADGRVAVHHRDGYEAINALLPPLPRRGLVFVDPPFESRDEFEQVGRALTMGLKRWPNGIFVAWYPIKSRNAVRALRQAFDANETPTFSCEFLARAKDTAGLSGSGLVICNPPWQIEGRLRSLGKELALAFDDTGSNYSMEWWVRERAV